MWYSNNGLQSITVAVDCGSALDRGGLTVRTSLWLAYAGLVMIRFNTVRRMITNPATVLSHYTVPYDQLSFLRFCSTGMAVIR